MGKKGGGNLGRQLTKSQTAVRKVGGRAPVGEGYLHTAELQVQNFTNSCLENNSRFSNLLPIWSENHAEPIIKVFPLK